MQKCITSIEIDHARNTVDKTLDLVSLNLEIIKGIDTFLSVIKALSTNNHAPENDNITNLAKIGLYYTNNQYNNLITQKTDLEESIDSLARTNE